MASLGQTVRESGRLSGSRADCQGVGQTVRESATFSESQQHSQRSGDVVMEAATSSHHHDDVVVREMATSSTHKHTHTCIHVHIHTEDRGDCQKVGKTVRKSGSLSESRGETRRVREAAATSSGKRRRHRQGNGDVISVTSVIATIS